MAPPLLPHPGDPLDLVSTPRPVIDEDRIAGNIARVQRYMDGHGLAFRPHIKTHKIPVIAQAQIAAGARGINCQKITEAEVFAQAGIEDILITFNIWGREKLERLLALHRSIRELKVTADSAETVEGLSEALRGADAPLKVLVECDTGAGRCGVQDVEAAVRLAARVARAPGLRFAGLMTYPPVGASAEVERFFAGAKARLEAEGIDCPILSNGGTPSLFDAHLVPSATEHRAGTYVYNDRSIVRAGACRPEDCAMHVLATVVSRPTATRAVIDAGSKALTSDLLGFADHGVVEDYPEARITALSEEHGVVDLGAGRRPVLGERLWIVPNHTCVVSNLFDHMVFHRKGTVTRVEAVAARGLVW